MLKLMYITNDADIASIADSSRVDRIMIDLESYGKSERQQGWNSFISNHLVSDIPIVKRRLKNSKLLVRINPVNEKTESEIETVIGYGADIIMLPYFKGACEVERFLKAVNARVKTSLLIETKEAVDELDEILALHGIDEVHIGLNDLSHSYGNSFLFEPVANGVVDKIVEKLKLYGIKSYGIGGIAGIGKGLVPAEDVICENIRLGSSCVILSRAFCDAGKIENIDEVRRVFPQEVSKVRETERLIEAFGENEFNSRNEQFKEKVRKVAQKIANG